MRQRDFGLLSAEARCYMGKHLCWLQSRLLLRERTVLHQALCAWRRFFLYHLKLDQFDQLIDVVSASDGPLRSLRRGTLSKAVRRWQQSAAVAPRRRQAIILIARRLSLLNRRHNTTQLQGAFTRWWVLSDGSSAGGRLLCTAGRALATAAKRRALLRWRVSLTRRLERRLEAAEAGQQQALAELAEYHEAAKRRHEIDSVRMLEQKEAEVEREAMVATTAEVMRSVAEEHAEFAKSAEAKLEQSKAEAAELRATVQALEQRLREQQQEAEQATRRHAAELEHVKGWASKREREQEEERRQKLLRGVLVHCDGRIRHTHAHARRCGWLRGRCWWHCSKL